MHELILCCRARTFIPFVIIVFDEFLKGLFQCLYHTQQPGGVKGIRPKRKVRQTAVIIALPPLRYVSPFFLMTEESGAKVPAL